MKEEWNSRYDCKEYRYGTEPNSFFRDQITGSGPGSLLLPAEGEGRNAVFAAQLGWDVTAFDFSSVARDKALSLAKERGVAIKYQTISAEDFCSEELFDAIALIFTHFPLSIRDAFLPKLPLLLKPGGKIIAEVYSKKQLANGTGGPKADHMLYSKDQFLAYFPQMEVIRAEEWHGHISEGDLHSGKSDTLRFVLQKK